MFFRVSTDHNSEFTRLNMPAFFLGIHCQIAFGEVESDLFCLIFINMHSLETFQEFGGRRDRGHIVADIELDDLVAITSADVFDGAGDFTEGVGHRSSRPAVHVIDSVECIAFPTDLRRECIYGRQDSG